MRIIRNTSWWQAGCQALPVIVMLELPTRKPRFRVVGTYLRPHNQGWRRGLQSGSLTLVLLYEHGHTALGVPGTQCLQVLLSWVLS